MQTLALFALLTLCVLVATCLILRSRLRKLEARSAMRARERARLFGRRPVAEVLPAPRKRGPSFGHR